MVQLDVIRFGSEADSTLGCLYQRRRDGTRKFLCFTLEDEWRSHKVRNETRIPPGNYRITLRTSGGMHPRYAARYGQMHRGMLHIEDVPEFEWIYIHTGNREDHTAGCLLVGNTANRLANGDFEIASSRDAYMRIYPPLAKAIESGEHVWIAYRDFDRESASIA